MKTTLVPTLAALVAGALGILPSHANYAVFEQHTDTINVPGQTVATTTMTSEAIVLIRSSHPHGGLIFRETTSGTEGKQLVVKPTGLHAVNNDGSSTSYVQQQLYAKVTVALDVWHHVAMVTDASEDRLYLDGKLVAYQPRYASIGNGTGTATVGARFTGTPWRIWGFVGVLDSIRVSSVARYSGFEFVPPHGDLPSDASTLLLYNFKTVITNTVVLDESPLARHGVLGQGFAGATAPQVVATLDGLPTTPARDISLDPRATYLRQNSDRPFKAIPIKLSSLGIAPGDQIFLQQIGDYNPTGDYEAQPDSADSHKALLGAVFSSSTRLTLPADLQRVADAIGIGQNFVTPNTGTGNLVTDIPQDFEVPGTGVVVTVPANAQYLFVAAIDVKYQDNCDWEPDYGVHISKVTLGMRAQAGRLWLNWDAGTLQSSPNLRSGWQNVPGANPPYTAPTSKPAEFFRLQVP